MKKKILIVDDENISLMMTNHILASEFETIMASSGEEAMSLYEGEKPDLVLSDLRMPGMSGLELQKNLKERYGNEIPFIFMTADRDEETESEGLRHGAMDYIHKPFRADVLLKRIGNILKMVELIQGFKKASETDPMTGLLNKASAEEEVGVLCKKASGALLVIDLDSFKPVNDLYGHVMGDRILIRFAEILQSAVRYTDITGRIGGDEFIAFCQNVSDESVIAEKTAYINENILSSAREILGDDMTIPLGASVGCVFVPDEGVDYRELFEKADKALYHVKVHGKHGYRVFHEKLTSSGDKNPAVSDFRNAEKILSERSPASGAYDLPFEQFRAVYRYLSRLVGNYKKEIWLILFTLHEVSASALSMEEASEQFLNVLSNSLRQSDVVTRSGKNQILAILNETSRKNCDTVIRRVLSNWDKAGADTGFDIAYEADKIKP